MCGFAGIASKDGSRQPEANTIRILANSLRHRGPDAEGVYVAEGIGLGFRRLSIIDLATGDQPLLSSDGRVAVACNGEIYNYRALRRALESRGRRFSSQSDIAVLPEAYQEFGLEFVELLDGMFAFALWDADKKLLVLGRDRLGIKPLYYALTKDEVLFASEPRGILAFPGFRRALDLVSFDQYLTFDYVPSPRTMYHGIRRVPAGHLLTYCSHTLESRHYWSPSFERSESRPPINASEYVEAFRGVLTEVTKDELQSDVPCGVFLSGGIDSSTIAAAITHGGSTVPAFSVAFEEKSFDESRYARRVAAHLGLPHRELTITAADCSRVLQGMGSLLDEPLADSSFIPSFLLSQFARREVKVVLGGDGGDELFAGYPTYLAHRLIELYERIIPLRLRATLIPELVKALPVSFRDMSVDFKLRRFLQGRGVPLLHRHHRWLASIVPEEKRELLSSELSSELFSTFAPVDTLIENCDAKDGLNKVMFCDLQLYLEGDILAKVDRASMSNGLEARVPMLNRRVVDFALGLPRNLKLRNLTTKYFLKRAAVPWLPHEIIHRKKKGFNFPVADWLVHEFREFVEATLDPVQLARENLFNPVAVRRLLDQHFAKQADHRKAIWNLTVFHLWYRSWCTAP